MVFRLKKYIKCKEQIRNKRLINEVKSYVKYDHGRINLKKKQTAYYKRTIRKLMFFK